MILGGEITWRDQRPGSDGASYPTWHCLVLLFISGFPTKGGLQYGFVLVRK
jgi:hypothetical protein